MRSTILLCVLFASISIGQSAEQPNVILMMADDLGWGDVAYNGHPHLKTPHLDEMAQAGIRFDRFYAAAPVCSPTRGSCLTGRHPFRYGIITANAGHLPEREPNLAEILKSHGYATGHFGKWHLGTLTRDVVDANRGGRPKNQKHYAPPWDRGFEVSFSTESKVPTFNPMIDPKDGARRQFWNATAPEDQVVDYNTRYWTGPGEIARDNLSGDDSRIVMDRAIPFIQENVKHQKPFFAVVWFHAPHWPVVADEEHRALYKDLDEFHQNHFGCITALDEQVGRLRAELRTLGIADDTLLWFCSDNGPEGNVKTGCGSAGPFRGRKRDLYEGGVRVPGLFEWPGRFEESRVIKIPCSTLDYFPTILAVLGYELPHEKQLPFDGINLLPILERKQQQRAAPIGFQSGKQLVWTEDQFKLYSGDAGKSWELYDLWADPSETQDLSAEHKDRIASMRTKLEAWKASCATDLQDLRP